MPKSGLDRRSFLRGAGATAVLGAVGARPAFAADLSGGRLGGGGPQVYDFNEIYDRVGTDCSKWDGPIATYGAGIEVGMGIADLDFRAAPCITQALAERCKHENWGYLRRPERYAEAVAEWNHRRYGLEVDPSTIVWTTGVHPGLIAALHTFSPPGTRVLLNTPVYSGFYTDLRFARTVAEESPLVLEDDGTYSIDFDDFERRASRANTFILCNPQNPTGNCWSAEDMLRLGEICLRHRVVVLADEIHCDFVTEGNTYTPFATLPDKEIVDNSITFKAASKSFSLAAMKVAWYFSTNPDLLERVRTNTRADLNTLGMEANYAALTEGEPWLDEVVTYLDGNHGYAESRIRELPYVKYRKAQGTYLAWLDVGELAERIGAVETASHETATGSSFVAPEDVVQRWLAENARVYLNPGDNYGLGGAGRMRMNLGAPRALIEKALDNMAGALAQV